MKILRGDSTFNYNNTNTFNSVAIEVKSDVEDSFDWAFDPLTSSETPTTQNFRVLYEGADISATWTTMSSFAESLGAYNAVADLYESELTYNPFGPNSNSVINSILNSIGLNLRDNTPFADGSTTQIQDPSEYPGHMGLLDGSGDSTFTAYYYDGTVQDTTDFYKRDGNDTITLEYSVDEDAYAELELIFDNVLAGDTHFTTVVLENLKYDDVDIERSNTFKITKGWNPFNNDLVRIDNFFTDNLSDNLAFEFEDYHYRLGSLADDIFDSNGITKNVYFDALDGNDTITISSNGYSIVDGGAGGGDKLILQDMHAYNELFYTVLDNGVFYSNLGEFTGIELIENDNFDAHILTKDIGYDYHHNAHSNQTLDYSQNASAITYIKSSAQQTVTDQTTNKTDTITGLLGATIIGTSGDDVFDISIILGAYQVSAMKSGLAQETIM